jgi:hypothetical protein
MARSSGLKSGFATRPDYFDLGGPGGPSSVRCRGRHRAFIARPPLIGAVRPYSAPLATTALGFVIVRTFAIDQARNAALIRATHRPHAPGQPSDLRTVVTTWPRTSVYNPPSHSSSIRHYGRLPIDSPQAAGHQTRPETELAGAHTFAWGILRTAERPIR